ncbi:MAG: cell division protein FtsA [Prevotellaceae bacterium]|jgi:cell division protein FtsA|nr:cell division protein FtsA [Prevotellaceae bacterium]
MEQNSYVTAIDIGTTKIATVIGSVTSRGRILVEEQQCTFSRGVSRGLVVNVEDTADSIRDCLDKLYEKRSVRPDRVVVGIAGRHISSRQSSAKRIRKKPGTLITESEVNDLKQDMYNIALPAGQKILHVIPQEYVVDGMPVAKAVGCPGNELVGNFYIVVSDANAVENIKMSIERCGLTMDSLMLEPIASANAVLTGAEKEAGTVLLDIGGGTSDMLIYYKNIVRSTVVIASGGQVITSDIRDACKISLQMAERLKCQYGACFSEYCSGDIIIPYYRDTAARDQGVISQKLLAEIIDERMEQLIDAVKYTIAESGYEREISSIVLTGGGAQLRHLPQLFKLRTGLDVRVGYPIVQIDNKDYTLKPTMATSVGLMMNGYQSRSSKAATNKLLEKIPIIGKAFGGCKELLADIFDEKNDPHLM